ncbi:hypothetical protein HPP92_015632 [Vanilla planifolia]|uniref:Bifunctional inhibitor/plant lipid transfer protein/seed storage helical domain-containing protein n=1 Tax=Vanilla planifolia TaxID=51239 RepID=A0A835QP07_VANPL|nr:hypothetical protein HPP92_015632 [Vanilla planifolia]
MGAIHRRLHIDHPRPCALPELCLGSSQTPSASCCSQLATVVQSNPVCLCLVLGGGASQFGVTINQTLALNLPVACDVRTPPVSRCKGVTDVTSPAQAPGGVTNVSRGRLLQPVATHVAFSLALVVVVYLFEPFVIF